MEQHPTEALPAFALECLDPQEHEKVRQHLAACAVCAAELERFEQTLAELPHAVPPVEPPDTLKARLLATVRPTRTFAWFELLLNRWPRLVPSLGLTALALAVMLGATTLFLMQQRGAVTGREIARMQLARFEGTPAMPDASGVLLVTADDREAVLVVSALLPLERSQQYQLWLIKDGQRSNGGVFSVSPAGDARLVVAADAPFSSYDAFGVTIEPYGGSPGPTGPKVLGGALSL